MKLKKKYLWNYINQFHKNALLIAIENECSEIVKLLLSHQEIEINQKLILN